MWVGGLVFVVVAFLIVALFIGAVGAAGEATTHAIAPPEDKFDKLTDEEASTLGRLRDESRPVDDPYGRLQAAYSPHNQSGGGNRGG